MNQQISLRKRLLLWIGFPILIAGLFALFFSFIASWHEIEEVYDAQLVHSAKVLLQITNKQVIEGQGKNIILGIEDPRIEHKYEKNISFRIWYKDILVTESVNSINFGTHQSPPGFSDQIINGQKWRVFVFVDEKEDFRIETSELYKIRYEIILHLMLSILAPGLIFIPIILAVVWIGIRKSFKPLETLSQDIDNRSIDDLTQIDYSKTPLEISSFVRALNNLFIRIEESFRKERDFVDNAAHQLRTPLAAMKTQTQVLMKNDTQDHSINDGLQNLLSSIDRSSNLVEQLLSFSRLQNENFKTEKSNISDLIEDILSDYKNAADQKNITIDKQIETDQFANIHPYSIDMMISNFVENAIKYAPQGGHVLISFSSGLLQICDNGVGLSDKEKEKVFDRFIRFDKTGQMGSGLGLSIAKWVAEAHALTITLSDNKPSGLIVSVQFDLVD